MKIIAWLCDKISKWLSLVPKEYYKDVKKEMAEINMARVRVISIIFISLNVFLIAFHLAGGYPRWSGSFQSLKYMYGNIAMMAERVAFLSVFYILKAKGHINIYKLKRYASIYSTIIMMSWCGHIGMTAGGLHEQIFTFIIGSFFIASLIFLLPLESIITYFISSCVFLQVLFLSNDNQADFMGSVVNILLVISFVIVMSYINTSLYCSNYINNMTIQKQAKELAESRDKLEEAVQERTEELIKEMGIRHEIEMQSIRTKLMYEENQKLLSEFKEYEELRTVFFTNLSHELRTPLNVIFSAQQMMSLILRNRTNDSDNEKLNKYNKIVKQNCYRLIRLIGNLIDITKIDANYFEINKRNCDIVYLVDNITQSVAEYIKNKNIELKYRSAEKGKIIACDPDKVERIILNLLSNAVKFTPESGTINVELYCEDKYVVIAVMDNGIGISREMQGAIFERFVQADKSTTRNCEGSGIGLSLVKSLVDLHQGNITLISEPGKGSKFIVKLPDLSIPDADCIACTKDDNGHNIERINIEFSDIYS